MELRQGARLVPLHKLCQSIVDCPHSTPTWTRHGVIVLRNQNIRDGKLDLSAPSYTDEMCFASRIRRARPVEGDLVITREAPMGEVCMIPIGLRCCLGQRMVLLRPDREEIAPKYLLYAIQSATVQAAIRNEGGTGSTVSNLRLPVLAALKIPVPATRVEQEDIAAALSDTDDLIAGLERLIAKKRAVKQAAMQQLLTGKTRLPEFSVSQALRSTEAGQIPVDWQVVPLHRICTLYNGRAYALHEWENTGVPVIRLQNLTGGTDYYYSRLQLPQEKYCYTGDLLYMWSATFGPHIWTGDKAIYHYHIWKVVPHEGRSIRKYLYYKLMEITEEKKTRASNGGTMLHVTKESMESTLIALPSISEQQVIAAVLSDMDAEIAALEQKRDKTRAIKQGMMQELLTGRIRLV